MNEAAIWFVCTLVTGFIAAAVLLAVGLVPEESRGPFLLGVLIALLAFFFFACRREPELLPGPAIQSQKIEGQFRALNYIGRAS